jgi:hypothetical protein
MYCLRYEKWWGLWMLGRPVWPPRFSCSRDNPMLGRGGVGTAGRLETFEGFFLFWRWAIPSEARTGQRRLRTTCTRLRFTTCITTSHVFTKLSDARQRWQPESARDFGLSRIFVCQGHKFLLFLMRVQQCLSETASLPKGDGPRNICTLLNRPNRPP